MLQKKLFGDIIYKISEIGDEHMNSVKQKNRENRFLRSGWCLFFLTVILLGLLMLGLQLEDVPETLPLSFYIKDSEVTQRVEGWFNEDGICYVFLPSHGELADIYAEKTSVFPVYFDGIRVESTVPLENISMGQQYKLETPVESFDVVFLQSSNVATMYIRTATGNMERIHADKDYKEDAEVIVFDKYGKLDYSGSGKLKGRGNSSWNAVKKPYLLNLAEPGNILDMGAANKWVLAANYSDQTYLRNKLAFDLAQKAGMEWTPECEYVDVYLNGIYNGLYLLSEKIEFGEHRLIQEDPGAFLCKVEYESRWDHLSNPVRTEFGRTIEIVDPTLLSDEEYKRIAQMIQEMEDAILYGSDEDLCRILDLDSWARRYLIDEIMANNDADIASSYFYYMNGKMFAGPVWDYDISLGNYYNIKNPHALYVNWYDPEFGGMPYYSALYQRKCFRDRVAQLYESEFLPVLYGMIDGGILSLADEISAAADMDVIRWNPEYGWLPSSVQLIGPDPDPQYLADYLQERADFLASVWIDGVDYCSVRVELLEDSPLAGYTVKSGEKFELYSQLRPLNEDVSAWSIAGTGALFDPDQIITEDLVLLQDHRLQ